MLPDIIMQSDLLDILFEDRNKNYGAYALRKSYNKTIRASIVTTIFLSACFALIILMHHNKEIYLTQTINLMSDPTLSSIKPPDPKPTQSSQTKHVNKVRQVNTSTPVITSDNNKSTQPTTNDIDKSIISNINKDGEASDEKIEAPPSGNSNATQSISATVASVADNDAPLISAEVMPEFPGGINALIKFIQRNIKQPDDLQSEEKIKVIASFIIAKDGTIENIKVISSGRADLDKEVIKVISKMPIWKPGIQNGKPVAVYFNLPVTFQNADEQ